VRRVEKTSQCGASSFLLSSDIIRVRRGDGQDM
jgi:hypothetical protein